MSNSVSCKPQQSIVPKSAHRNTHSIQYKNFTVDFVWLFQEAESIDRYICWYFINVLCDTSKLKLPRQARITKKNIQNKGTN